MGVSDHFNERAGKVNMRRREGGQLGPLEYNDETFDLLITNEGERPRETGGTRGNTLSPNKSFYTPFSCQHDRNLDTAFSLVQEKFALCLTWLFNIK